MDGCSYRLNLWPDEVSFSIAHVTECPAYFHTYIRYVRIFFINANCSKTKAGSVIQRTCCLQQSTFTILWSLKGIKSNYRSGFWVVRNGSILFLRTHPCFHAENSWNNPGFRSMNSIHSSSRKNSYELLPLRVESFDFLCIEVWKRTVSERCFCLDDLKGIKNWSFKMSTHTVEKYVLVIIYYLRKDNKISKLRKDTVRRKNRWSIILAANVC